MSVEPSPKRLLRKNTLLWAVLACSGLALAEEVDAPDLEFLEYLGSWQGLEEDWVLVAGAIDVPAAPEQKDEEKSPPADGETQAEKGNEN
jgi:hypothetical protein